MGFYSLFIIALALSLDAFGVSLSLGLNNKINFNNKTGFVISFGFFQFLFSIIGAYTGFLFNTYVVSVPEIIGGTLIALVGILMIKEGFKENQENILLNFYVYIVLGISVSIDALVIGFTALSNLKNNIQILNSTLFIGLVTIFMSILSFIISRYLKKIDIVSKYADFIGGIILLLFGLKMMFF